MAGHTYTSKGSVPFDFELDGVPFTATSVSTLDLCELSRLADVDIASKEGATALGDFFANALGGDYDRFRAHCRTHGTDDETLLAIMSDLVETVAGRPTQRPSVSADGPLTTGRTWRVISSDGTVRETELTPERETELRQAIAEAEEQESVAG